MTFYVKDITTTASTTSTTTIKCWGGVVTKGSVMFPPGPQGLLQVRLLHGGHQFAPSNTDGYFASDNETVSWDEFYKLEPGFNAVRVEAKNTDTVHAHTCTVRINILPISLAVPYYMMEGVASSLRRILARMGVT